MVTLVGPLTRPTCSGASAAVGPVDLTGTCRSTPRRGNGAGAALVPTNGTARLHQRQLGGEGEQRSPSQAAAALTTDVQMLLECRVSGV